MNAKLLSQITAAKQKSSVRDSLIKIPIESSPGYLSRLVTKWRRDQNYLGSIKPSTDIGDLEKQLIDRPCRCGCGVSFRVLPLSDQWYRSRDCFDHVRALSHDAKSKWRQGMSYMVRG